MARKTGVTREQVIDAACDIADRDGLTAVTMAAVAAAVGVRSPSLYAHVDGLDGLRRAIARRAYCLLTESFTAAATSNDDPLAALRAIALSYRAFAAVHPGLYASLLPAPRPDADPDGATTAAEPVRVIAHVLTRLGISPDHHIDVIRTLRALLHGFADLENGNGFGLDAPVDASFDSAVDLIVESLAAKAPAPTPR